MKNVFFKDHVQITLPSNLTDDFEHLIGAFNEPLEENFGVRICYDQEENVFSGFALLNQGEKNNFILSAFKNGVADAILEGHRSETHEQMHYYKQGYDFGLTMYSELNKLDE
jgi:hypothetical protein